MGWLYIIQIAVALFVYYQISRMVNIFGKGKFQGEKRFDEKLQADVLFVANPPSLMKDALQKINNILINRQRNKFYVSSYTVEDVVDGLAHSAEVRVKAFISIHIAVALLAISSSFSGLAGVGELYNISIEREVVQNLATQNQSYWFVVFYVVLVTALLMSLEFIYWLFSQNRMNDRKIELMSFIDTEFQDSMLDDIRLVLAQFSDIQDKMNRDMEQNNALLDAHLKEMAEVVGQQSEHLKVYSEYVEALREIKVEDLVVDTVKLQADIASSIKVAGQYYPQFASLSKSLNETLNRSIALYEQLNEAISRDAQFSEGIDQFNYNVKHNGHVTAKLLETLNTVQTHVNQVLLVHGPRIEDLDNAFFEYLQERLSKLKEALQKSDELMIKELKKVNKERVRSIKNE